MIEFKEKDRTMIYDFDQLCGGQIIMAEQAFIIHYEKMNKSPHNMSELESTVTHSSLFKAYGTLLLEKRDDEILPFSFEKNSGIEFVKRMSAANMKLMQSGNDECKGGVMNDFFSKLGKPSPSSTKLLKDLMTAMVNVPSSGAVSTAETMANVGNLLKVLTEKPDSSTEMNATEEQE